MEESEICSRCGEGSATQSITAEKETFDGDEKRKTAREKERISIER